MRACLQRTVVGGGVAALHVNRTARETHTAVTPRLDFAFGMQSLEKS